VTGPVDFDRASRENGCACFGEAAVNVKTFRPLANRIDGGNHVSAEIEGAIQAVEFDEG
jgi:hypothetical protein